MVDAVFFDHEATWHAVGKLYPAIPEEHASYVPLTVLSPEMSDYQHPPRRLLTIGRLVQQKNHASTLTALRAVLDRGHQVELTVVGDGPLRSELKSLVQELELCANVRMIGAVASVDALLREHDLYVQASTYEGLGRSVLEAMAAGKLVVSTDVGAVKFYGCGNYNMIKAAGTDPTSFAEALCHAIETTNAEADAIRRGAIDTVEKLFSPTVVRPHWSKALRVVESLVSLKARN
jgi:glycosyltransferase involved in cell wall biosynthesis